MVKEFFRTITVDWLRDNCACEYGIKLFQDRVKGDRATIRFTSDDFLWMQRNFARNYHTSEIPGCLDYDDAFLHVSWLYRRIAANSNEMLTAFAEEGLDLDLNHFYVLNGVQPPRGYKLSYQDAYSGKTVNYLDKELRNTKKGSIINYGSLVCSLDV